MYLDKNILTKYKISNNQFNKINQYIEAIKKYNAHTNIVGKTTLINPWQTHILDSIQITNLIKNKTSSILDMGTGAGLPGLVLAINNYKNVSLVDSNIKKIKFLKLVSSNLQINVKIHHKRIESMKNFKFDFLIARALSNLSRLFFYSQNLLSKDTVLIFLKGKTVRNEIEIASSQWYFKYKLQKSISDERGNILKVWDLKKLNA